MNEERFWSLIEGAWPKNKRAAQIRAMIRTGELEESDKLRRFLRGVLKNLSTNLEELPAEELLLFDRILEQKLYDIDREDIHSYTDGSDDGFLYCRGFIVIAGQEFYNLVNDDPSKALLDVEFEDICYHPWHMYRRKFGEMPYSGLSRESGSNKAGWDSGA